MFPQQFPTDTAEHLAALALRHAGGNTSTAIDRLTLAIDALKLWQRLAALEHPEPGPARRRPSAGHPQPGENP